MKPTTALYIIHALLSSFSDKGVFVFQGGQGAGKTISVLIEFLDIVAKNERCEMTVIGAELTKMKLTVIPDFKDLAMNAGHWDRAGKWNEQKCIFKYANKRYIEFVPADKEDVGKGMRRKWVYFNEANRIPFAAYDQIASRADKVIIDYNPDLEFWVHSEILKGGKWHTITIETPGLGTGFFTFRALVGKDFVFTILTFEHNEMLGAAERSKILDYKVKADAGSSFYDNKWRVYGLGQPGLISGLIYPEWVQCQSIPDTAKILGYAVDFGFGQTDTADPTAVVEVWKDGQSLYVKEKLYRRGILIDELSEFLKANCNNPDAFMVADGGGGGAQMIAELRKRGVGKIQPVRKRSGNEQEGSIMYGIGLLQTYKVHVLETSINIWAERGKYRYDNDTPVDKDNHTLDGIRYTVMHFHAGLVDGNISRMNDQIRIFNQF